MELRRISIETDGGLKIQPSGGSRVFFNPNQYTITKKVSWKSQTVLGLDVPVQHFQTGEPRTIGLSLLFDTYEDRTDVRDLTTQVAQLAEVKKGGRPPLCRFFWGPDQPNAGKLAFQGVIDSLTQKFTLFLDDGTPVRATVDLSLREIESPERQLKRIKPDKGSPLQARWHVVKRGDTLWGIAAAEYKDPARWRPIARANAIRNPRVLEPGALLLVPPVE